MRNDCGAAIALTRALDFALANTVVLIISQNCGMNKPGFFGISNLESPTRVRYTSSARLHNELAVRANTSETIGISTDELLSCPIPEKRIIKGRPFRVGLIVRINAYKKEHPHGDQIRRGRCGKRGRVPLK